MCRVNQLPEGLTFDDVLLVPAYSEVLPHDVSTATRLTPRIRLAIPIMSAAMDTVTESRMAIMMARLGGIGVIHRNLPPDEQAAEVDRVKRSQAGMITAPVYIPPDATVGDARLLMERFHVSGLPVTDDDGRLVGIVTNRDIRFEEHNERPVREVMTRDGLITAREGTSLEEAQEIFRRHRIEKLPIVDGNGMLRGLITVKDLGKRAQYPDATQDERGRLQVAAAVGVGEEAIRRADLLDDAGADAIVVDTAHGHTRAVVDTVRILRDRTRADIIAGNVVTAEGARALAEAGADAVKAGVGPGCFAAGTRVLMADATYRNIEDVRPGDRVINMNGEPVTVRRAWCTGVREVMAIRHTASYRETLVTADHCFFVGDVSTVSPATMRSSGYVATLERPIRFGISKLRWKEIGACERDVLLLPQRVAFELPDGFEIDLRESAVRKDKQLARYHTRITDSYELGYVFGTFLGDGHAFIAPSRNSEQGRVSWYFALGEGEIAAKLIRCLKAVTGLAIEPASDDRIINVHLYSLQWARLLAQFGKRHEKHLPPEYLCGNSLYLKGLFDGLIDSDGYVEAGGRLSFRNTSPQLVELFNVLCYLVEGSFPNSATEPASAGGLKGTSDDACRESYRSRLNVTHVKRRTGAYQVVKRLRGRQLGTAVPVYDIEVECPTHSFIADNAVVHNSICTTRVVAGVGMPQLSAISECAAALDGLDVGVIGDGGVRHSGDITKALAAGADVVMLGSLLAGTDESPGEVIFERGEGYKEYRGMGSLRAMMGRGFSRDRYRQEHVTDPRKLVPEGVEARVPYRGALERLLNRLVGGLRQGMGYLGAAELAALRQARMVRVTAAGQGEGQPHSVEVMEMQALL